MSGNSGNLGQKLTVVACHLMSHRLSASETLQAQSRASQHMCRVRPTDKRPVWSVSFLRPDTTAFQVVVSPKYAKALSWVWQQLAPLLPVRLHAAAQATWLNSSAPGESDCLCKIAPQCRWNTLLAPAAEQQQQQQQQTCWQ